MNTTTFDDDAITDALPETPPAYSGKLSAIIVHSDGAKRIIYDGAEVDVDSVALTEAEQAEVDAATYTPTTPQQLQATLVQSIQSHVDAQAVALGYDNIFTAVSYADEPSVPKFQAEGAALRAWRSQVWAACYAYLADVQTGVRAFPTTAEAIAALPTFVASDIQ